MKNMPRTDAELAADPSDLEEAVLALLEQAGIDTATCDAIMKLVERGEKIKAGDEDDGVDPTTPELLKPRGNAGVVSPDICFDALLLVGDTAVTELQTEAWTQEQRDKAYDWAMRMHLVASDNDDVYLPERPWFIPYAERRGVR